jgi:hypothetical protein
LLILKGGYMSQENEQNLPVERWSTFLAFLFENEASMREFTLERDERQPEVRELFE